MNQARDILNSEVRTFDFAGNSKNAEREINMWTHNKTFGKISELYEPGNKTMIKIKKIVNQFNTVKPSKSS